MQLLFFVGLSHWNCVFRELLDVFPPPSDPSLCPPSCFRVWSHKKHYTTKPPEPHNKKVMAVPGFEPGSSGSQPLMLTTTLYHHSIEAVLEGSEQEGRIGLLGLVAGSGCLRVQLL
jgi:hypothetical protein